MVAMLTMAAVLSTRSPSDVEARTIAAARQLAGLTTSTVPISLSPSAPAGASRNVEGWTTFNDDGTPVGVFIYTHSGTFVCAARSAETTTCLLRLASILVHEVWHFEQGADEDGAYGAQLDFLNKVGVPPRVIRDVMAAHAVAVSADRNRIHIHRQSSRRIVSALQPLEQDDVIR